jgi:ABC-type amino acid transport system permease subunit
VEIFSLVLLFYFAIAQVMALGTHALEKKLAGAIARGRAP